jgi:predicted Fe-Mo cluster-binding NifX family protein
MIIAVPFDPETGMVAEHFGHAPYMKLYSEESGVVFTDVIQSPANGHDGVCRFLAENGIKAVICANLGEGARDALFDAGIAVFAGVMGPADDIVVALLENRLRYVTEATCHHHHGEGGCSCGCGCDGDSCSDEGCGCGCGC